MCLRKIDRGGGARRPPTCCSRTVHSSYRVKTPYRYHTYRVDTQLWPGAFPTPCVAGDSGGPSRPPLITLPYHTVPKPRCLGLVSLLFESLHRQPRTERQSTTSLQIPSFFVLLLHLQFASLRPHRRIPSLRASFPRSSDGCPHSSFTLSCRSH